MAAYFLHGFAPEAAGRQSVGAGKRQGSLTRDTSGRQAKAWRYIKALAGAMDKKAVQNWHFRVEGVELD